MAVVRARIERAPICLASATPSLETRVNAEQGRYRWLKLPSRFGERELPDIRARSTCASEGPPRGRWLSPRLVAGVEAGLAAGEQSLLFLNRRGYAPLTLCRACGHRFQCPNCSAWLVEHRFRARSSAITAAMSRRGRRICPQCQEADTPRRLRPRHRAPRRRSRGAVPRHRARWCCPRIFPAGSSGCAPSSTRRRAATTICIIGTQLVAKGHNFPLADAGRHRRRRRRPRQRRSARRRAHVPAPAPGDRARRARREAGPRAGADLAARAPGDRRARRRATPSASTPRRASSGGAAACRRSAASRRSSFRARTAAAAEAHARALARAAHALARQGRLARRAARRRSRRPTRSRCSARPRRRSRCCAAVIASASPSRRRARADLQGFLRAPARRRPAAARRRPGRRRRRSAELSLRVGAAIAPSPRRRGRWPEGPDGVGKAR